MRDQAITLVRLDYSETSQVLVLLTRDHGRQRLIAKGIRRGTRQRFATGIDLLERGEVVFLRRSPGDATLGTLTEWRQRDLHLGLRQELRRLYAGQYAVEVTAAMTEDADPHPGLFDALADVLAGLARGGDPLGQLAAYQCALLTAEGLWPDLTRCVMCDRPAPPRRAATFSAQQGGLVCRNCEGPLLEKRTVSAATLSALREQFWAGDTAPGAFDLLDYTICHVMGREPALTKFVRASVR